MKSQENHDVRWFHKDAFYINLCLIYSGFLLLLEMPLNSQNNILVLVNLYLSLYLYLSAHSHYALPEQMIIINVSSKEEM